MFVLAWCFLVAGKPWSFVVFSGYFPGILRVRKVSKILGVCEVFLGLFDKIKEKKDGFVSELFV